MENAIRSELLKEASSFYPEYPGLPIEEALDRMLAFPIQMTAENINAERKKLAEIFEKTDEEILAEYPDLKVRLSCTTFYQTSSLPTKPTEPEEPVVVSKPSKYSKLLTEAEYDKFMTELFGSQWEVKGTQDNALWVEGLKASEKEMKKVSAGDIERKLHEFIEHRDGSVWTMRDTEMARRHRERQEYFGEEPTPYIPGVTKLEEDDDEAYQSPSIQLMFSPEPVNPVQKKHNPTLIREKYKNQKEIYVNSWNWTLEEFEDLFFCSEPELRDIIYPKTNPSESTSSSNKEEKSQVEEVLDEADADLAKAVRACLVQDLGENFDNSKSAHIEDFNPNSYEYKVEAQALKQDEDVEDYEPKLKIKVLTEYQKELKLEGEKVLQKLDPWGRDNPFRDEPHKITPNYMSQSFLYMKAHYAGVFDGIPKALDPTKNFYNDLKLVHTEFDFLKICPITPEPEFKNFNGVVKRVVVDESKKYYYSFNNETTSLLLQDYLKTGKVTLRPEYQSTGQLIPNFQLPHDDYIKFYATPENENPFSTLDLQTQIPVSFLNYTELKKNTILDEYDSVVKNSKVDFPARSTFEKLASDNDNEFKAGVCEFDDFLLEKTGQKCLGEIRVTFDQNGNLTPELKFQVKLNRIKGRIAHMNKQIEKRQSRRAKAEIKLNKLISSKIKLELKIEKIKNAKRKTDLSNLKLEAEEIRLKVLKNKISLVNTDILNLEIQSKNYSVKIELENLKLETLNTNKHKKSLKQEEKELKVSTKEIKKNLRASTKRVPFVENLQAKNSDISSFYVPAEKISNLSDVSDLGAVVPLSTDFNLDAPMLRRVSSSSV